MVLHQVALPYRELFAPVEAISSLMCPALLAQNRYVPDAAFL